MQELAEKILMGLPTMDFEKYWDGFHGNAFAIYNADEVCLFNHPKCAGNSYISIPKTDQFVSCTYIFFEEVPTAIVDIRYFDSFEDIYSLIVHESFHTYQNSLGESRFPNEAIGPAFPADFQLIQLRILERKVLFDAVMQGSNGHLLDEFIALRDERLRLFPAVVEYENRVETIEGPAFFVEYQALREIDDSETALQRYSNLLLNAEDSHVHIRKSCYGSGLFLCLLLDQIASRWQDDFMHSELDLYHFFKKLKPDYRSAPISLAGNKDEVNYIIEKMQQQKKDAVQSFNDHSGIKLTLTGTIQSAGFDPMNLVIHGNQALHKHFLKIRIGSNEYFIDGPVLTLFDDDFMKIKTLEVFLKEPPARSSGDSLEIEGMGTFTGHIDDTNKSSIQVSLK